MLQNLLVLATAATSAAVASTAPFKMMSSDPSWTQWWGKAYGSDVDISGKLALVGAKFDNPKEWGPWKWAGAVYVVETSDDGATWTNKAKLEAPDRETWGKKNPQFGAKVALRGNTAFVAAPNDAENGSLSGAVYVFGTEDGGATWALRQKLLGPTRDWYFGMALDANDDGTTLIVGHSSHAGGGAAHVYQTTDGGKTYNLVSTVQPKRDYGTHPYGKCEDANDNDGAGGTCINPNDSIGYAVALEGDKLAIGAPSTKWCKDSGYHCAGAVGSVYIFQTADGGKTWVELDHILGEDIQSFNHENFGKTLDMRGNTIVIGAPGKTYDMNGNWAAYIGQFYIFDSTDGKTWTQTFTANPVDLPFDGVPKMGASVVKFSGDNVVVGTPQNGHGGQGPGFVKIYGSTDGKWSELQTLRPSPHPCTGGCAFGSAVGVGDCALVVGAIQDDTNTAPGVGAGYGAGAAFSFKLPGTCGGSSGGGGGDKPGSDKPDSEPVKCDNDVTAIACRSFKQDADFQVERAQNSGDDQTYDVKAFLPYNAALMAVTTDPWDKLSDEDNKPSFKFGQDTDGCVFYEARNGNQKAVRLTGSSDQSGNRHKCKSQLMYGCNALGQAKPADRNAVEQVDKWDGKIVEKDGELVAKGGRKGRDGLVYATNQVTLKHLVQNLNTQGAYEMYYHRVQENPITGVQLKWIAENACKVSVPVSFQCTGSDCVEVQNIVCASFAGIDAQDYGVVSIECKVPPSKFIINSFKKECRDSRSTARDGDRGALDGVTTNQPGGNGAQETRECLPQRGIEYGKADKKFKVTQDGDNAMRINSLEFQFGAPGINQACTGGTCSITVKSKKAIGETDNIQGSVSIHADVKSLQQQPRKWTEKLNHFHTAEYNLTRESAPEKVLEMPIGVNFYTDHCDQAALNKPHPSGDDKTMCPKRSGLRSDKHLSDNKIFGGSGIDSVPFLANQEVNLGKIKKNVHGYFRLVAKVKAPNTWFLSREVTALEVSKEGGEFETANAKCQTIGPESSAELMARGYNGNSANPLYHTTARFPVSYIGCPKLMAQRKAGDVMRFSLAWQLASLRTDESGNGKAQLLQDADEADPNAQSVEVQVTIQLGGGETNITTGTAEGAASADNTVTYIIIAVCVIAAALILAVVVVAFMCLRNRSQEQLVAMSPKQATVAAVYDISAPKKGDVMDV